MSDNTVLVYTVILNLALFGILGVIIVLGLAKWLDK